MRLPALKIRHKILLLMVALLLFASISYSTLATRLFNTDKAAYIYETNALLVETLSADVQTSFSSNIKTISQISAALSHAETTGSDQRNIIKSIFDSDEELVEVTIFPLKAKLKKTQETKPLLNIYKTDYLALYNLTKEFFSDLREKRPIPKERIQSQELVFQNATVAGGAPLISIYLKLRSKGKDGHLVVANIRQDRLLSLFSKSDVYTTYLIDSLGNVLAHSNSKEVLEDTNVATEDFAKSVLQSEFQSGAQEFSDREGKEYIAAYHKLNTGGLTLISYIWKEKAFLAAKQLVEKTVFFGILITLVSIIFSILFSRQLTAALHKLFLATQKIARGEFDLQVNIHSKDEVGALSTAFDKMAKEIQRLLVETHEKAQIEKELETAQTVQDNLFPAKNFDAKKFTLSGYYTPASKCGGDWWGYIPVNNKLVVLVGDATGHGVPAALVTAAAQSCCTTLTHIGSNVVDLLLSPKQIMQSLNTAVYYAAKGSIKMTFFVSVIDLETGEMTYCNASHEMPLISRLSGPPGSEREKSQMTALSGSPDLTLGDSPDGNYHDHTYQLKAGDVIAWYSDGITECRNGESEEEWGERRFIRALLKSASKNVDEIKNDIITKVLDFTGDSPMDDDVTLVIGKVDEHASFTEPKTRTRGESDRTGT